MGTLLQDLRFGLRMLAKNPGFTAVAVLALAVGIAVNTTIFTAYNAVLRPIQATDPSRVVNIYQSATSRDRYGRAFNYPDYVYYRDHNDVFSSLIAASGAELALSDPSNVSRSAAQAGGITALAGIRFFQQVAGTAEFIRAAVVSENYFAGLGINPFMGRVFTPEEARGSGPVVMLSYNFWQRRFSSRPEILGKTLKLNGKQFTVIGITPKDFMGTYENVQSVWLPFGAFPLLEPGRDPLHNREDECCNLYARLKPGVSRQEAQSAMTVLAHQLRRTYPQGSNSHQPVTITLTPGSPFGPGPSPEVLAVVALVMGAMSLVLLIACANVAGMQLARSAARQKEFGVRLALGASRGRLVRQLLTDATLLAVLAGGVGLLMTWWAVRYLVSAISDALPAEWGILSLQVDPDLRVFGYTLLVSLVAGILFGLAPALESSKPNLISVLKQEGATFGRHLARMRLRDVLVATQVAVCLVLLIAAGLLARGSARAVRINPGFETKKVLGMGVDMPDGLGYDAAKQGAVVHQLVDRLSLVSGVKSVSVGRAPLAGGVRSTAVFLGNQKESKAQAPVLNYSYVSPNFFATLSIPIIRGRTFTDDEARSRANVTVISQAAARTLWPGQDPIGKYVTLDARDQYHDEPFPSGQSFQVIGITPDLRSVWLNELDPGYFYMPIPPNQYYESVLIRTEGDPNSLTAALGPQIKAVDPSVIVYAETLDGLITNNPGFIFSRVGAILSTIIGVLGLLLASIGIYGMVSYVVVQRTREVGVRMALGAQRSDVLRLIVRGSMKPVVIGLIFGVVAAGAASRLLSTLLFGISSLDPMVYLGVSLFLASVAALAAWMPARRATKVDPIVALRYE
jgi:predicted permease